MKGPCRYPGNSKRPKILRNRIPDPSLDKRLKMMIRSAVSRKEEKIGKTNIGPDCSNSNNATIPALSKQALRGIEELTAHRNY